MGAQSRAQPQGGRLMPALWEGTANLSRRLIDKAGYCGHARARDRGEVRALGDDRASLRAQLPVKADAIVMPIDRPGATETVAGKALLHRPHHAIDLGVPFAGHQRIDITGAFAEGLGDQPLPPVGIGLVPYGDVTLDQIIKFAHFCLLTYGTFSCAPEVSAMPRRRSITSQVIGRYIRGGVSCAHGTAASRGWRALARVAFASPPESARPRLRGRDLDPAFELCRNRASIAEPRYAAASSRTARRADARAQCAPGGSRLCADLSRTLFTGSGARGGACRDRPRAGPTEAVPRFRSRPALVHRRQQ